MTTFTADSYKVYGDKNVRQITTEVGLSDAIYYLNGVQYTGLYNNTVLIGPVQTTTLNNNTIIGYNQIPNNINTTCIGFNNTTTGNSEDVYIGANITTGNTANSRLVIGNMTVNWNVNLFAFPSTSLYAPNLLSSTPSNPLTFRTDTNLVILKHGLYNINATQFIPPVSVPLGSNGNAWKDVYINNIDYNTANFTINPFVISPNSTVTNLTIESYNFVPSYPLNANFVTGEYKIDGTPYLSAYGNIVSNPNALLVGPHTSVVSGADNVSIGNENLASANIENTSLGTNNTGTDNNVLIGSGNTATNGCVLIGKNITATTSSIVIGSGTTGTNNIIIGSSNATSTNPNVLIGYNNTIVNNNVSSSVIVGYNTCQTVNIITTSVIIGDNACNNSGSTQGNVIIGSDNVPNFAGSSNVILGINYLTGLTTSDFNVMVGSQVGIFQSALNTVPLSIDYNTFLGYKSGIAIDNNTNNNVFIGFESGGNNSATASRSAPLESTGVGRRTLASNATNDSPTSNYSVGIGDRAGLRSNGDYHVYIGGQAGHGNRIGNSNSIGDTIFGYQAYYSGNVNTINPVSPSYNTIISHQAYFNNNLSGHTLIVMGQGAIPSATSTNTSIYVGNRVASTITSAGNAIIFGADNQSNTVAKTIAFGVSTGSGAGIANGQSDANNNVVFNGRAFGPNSVCMGYTFNACNLSSIAIGYQTGDYTNDYCTFIGNSVGYTIQNVVNTVIIRADNTNSNVNVRSNSVNIGISTGGNATDTTFIGSNSGNVMGSVALRNVCLGYSSFASVTTATDLTNIGYDNMNQLTTTSQHTIIGFSNANGITTSTGSYTLIGNNLMNNPATTPTFSVHIGSNTGYGNQTVLIGVSAGTGTRWNAVAIGYQADGIGGTTNDTVIIGDSAGNTVVTDTRSVIIGDNANASATTDYDVVVLGANNNAGRYSTGIGTGIASSANRTNAIGQTISNTNSRTTSIGNNITSTHRTCIHLGQSITSVADNYFILGSNITQMRMPGVTAGTGTTAIFTVNGDLMKQSSSIRYKKNITDLEQTNIYDLIPRSFDFIKSPMNSPTNFPTTRSHGFIAEEVQKVMPGFVTYKQKQIQTVNYKALVAPIIHELIQLRALLKKYRT